MERKKEKVPYLVIGTSGWICFAGSHPEPADTPCRLQET